MLVFGVLAAEVGLDLVSIAMARGRSGAAPSPGTEVEGEAAEAPDPNNPHFEVIHPFLGFVNDPDRYEAASALGFPHMLVDPFEPLPDGGIKIAVFGSSYTAGVVLAGHDLILSRLEAEGIKARLMPVTVAGYKQPQQLIALTYLLSLGATIDFVVNIDGFAEVALPPAENSPHGVNPFYPRSWHTRARMASDPAVLAEIGRMADLRERRERWRRRAEALPEFSIARKLLWPPWDARLAGAMEKQERSIRKARSAGRKSFMRTGPALTTRGEDEFFDALARQWAESSLLMKAICDGRGVPYLHFLHPNQYDEPGRELNAEELSVAFHADHPYRRGVIRGYPLLREQGRELLRQGVDFHDLSFIFKDTPSTVYADQCCHSNAEGYRIIAERVAAEIIRVMKARAGRKDPPEAVSAGEMAG